MRHDVMPGEQIAGYRIEGVLGRGGMSVVYLAEQVRLGRKVALKLLAPALADDEAFRARFEREWRLAASIDDPNIIPIYDAGEANGHLYLAMKFVEGLDLRALLARKGPLDLGETLSILSQVASALDAAHAYGLVHRDVKPGNVLVMAGRGPAAIPHVFLADFGLTKRSASQSGLTRLGQFVGTLDYVAPEQIEGKALDGRTDLYALGCVLYECLSGEPPFPRDSDPAVLYAHLREPVPSVEARRKDLPPGIDAIIARATAKQRDERYETGGALIAALQDLIAPSSAIRPKPTRGKGQTTTVEPVREPAAGETTLTHEAEPGVAERVRTFLVDALPGLPPSPLKDRLAAVAAVLAGPLQVAVVGLEPALVSDLAETLSATIGSLSFRTATAGFDAARSPSRDDVIAQSGAHVVVIPLKALGTPPLGDFLGRLRRGGASPVRSIGVLEDVPLAGALPLDRGVVQASAVAYLGEPTVRATLGTIVALTGDQQEPTGNAALPAVFEAIRGTLGQQAARLLADWAVIQVDAAFRAEARGTLGAEVETLLDNLEELRLQLFELDELHALDDLLAGRLTLPKALGNELERLLHARDPAVRLGLEASADAAAIRAAAQAGAERWRSFLSSARPSGALRGAAEVAAGAYDRLWSGTQDRPRE